MKPLPLDHLVPPNRIVVDLRLQSLQPDVALESLLRLDEPTPQEADMYRPRQRSMYRLLSTLQLVSILATPLLLLDRGFLRLLIHLVLLDSIDALRRMLLRLAYHIQSIMDMLLQGTTTTQHMALHRIRYQYRHTQPLDHTVPIHLLRPIRMLCTLRRLQQVPFLLRHQQALRLLHHLLEQLHQLLHLLDRPLFLLLPLLRLLQVHFVLPLHPIRAEVEALHPTAAADILLLLRLALTVSLDTLLIQLTALTGANTISTLVKPTLWYTPSIVPSPLGSTNVPKSAAPSTIAASSNPSSATRMNTLHLLESSDSARKAIR